MHNPISLGERENCMKCEPILTQWWWLIGQFFAAKVYMCYVVLANLMYFGTLKQRG